MKLACAFFFFFETDGHDGTKSEGGENLEEKKLDAAFETWKSKTYALTVPLTVAALRGSIPPSWVKVCCNVVLYIVPYH